MYFSKGFNTFNDKECHNDWPQFSGKH